MNSEFRGTAGLGRGGVETLLPLATATFAADVSLLGDCGSTSMMPSSGRDTVVLVMESKAAGSFDDGTGGCAGNTVLTTLISLG